MEERRKNPRAAADFAARLTVGQETIEGRVRDICRDAVLVQAARSYPLQTPVRLEMELPGQPAGIRASGKVVRLAANERGPHGMAILFDDELPPDTALRIDLFVQNAER